MTATEVIKAALRRLGVVEEGSSPTASQLSDGLEVLNDLLSSWSSSYSLVYEDTRETLTLTSGTRTYTIGSTGTLATARPLKINSATIRDDGIDYPVKVIQSDEYNRIDDKTISERPENLFYRKTYPNGIIYFDYIPDENYSLILDSIKELTSFPDTTTDIDLPAHYSRALKANLTVELAPEYERVITPAMSFAADESKNFLLGQSVRFEPSVTDLPTASDEYNINADS